MWTFTMKDFTEGFNKIEDNDYNNIEAISQTNIYGQTIIILIPGMKRVFIPTKAIMATMIFNQI